MENTKVESAIKLIVVVVTVMPILMLGGWVTVKLWDWFVVPLGVTPLSLWWAVGINILAGHVCKNAPDSYDPTLPEIIGRVLSAATTYLLVLLFGWIAHVWM